MHRKAPLSASSVASSRPSARVDSKTIKLARAYYENSGKDTNVEYGNVSSILEELYAWEKKLYKEVKVYIKLSFTHTHHHSESYIPNANVSHICLMSNCQVFRATAHHLVYLLRSE